MQVVVFVLVERIFKFPSTQQFQLFAIIGVLLLINRIIWKLMYSQIQAPQQTLSFAC